MTAPADVSTGPTERGDHPSLLVFTPRAWDPVTRHELARYLAEISGIDGAGTIGAAIGGRWDEAAEGRFPAWTDLDADGAIARSYGVNGEFAVIVLAPDGSVWRTSVRHSDFPPPADIANALRRHRRGAVHSRAAFILATLASALVVAGASRSEASESADRPVRTSRRACVSLTVNGTARRLEVDPRCTTAEALRGHLALTGTKIGCATGQCGACTILVDGDRQLSCISLAVMQQGRSLTTIEGVSAGADLHPVQRALVAHDGLQCGFCTPGQVISAIALMREGEARTESAIRESMSGNLCRCGAYSGIVAAIMDARGTIGTD